MSEPAKVFEDPLVSGDWCVEREDGDGRVELAIFSGADARDRALLYADWRYRQFTQLP
jgi:hypothetical protein